MLWGNINVPGIASTGAGPDAIALSPECNRFMYLLVFDRFLFYSAGNGNHMSISSLMQVRYALTFEGDGHRFSPPYITRGNKSLPHQFRPRVNYLLLSLYSTRAIPRFHVPKIIKLKRNFGKLDFEAMNNELCNNHAKSFFAMPREKLTGLSLSKFQNKGCTRTTTGTVLFHYRTQK